MAGRADRAEEQGRDGELVAGGEQQAVREGPGPGQRTGGEQPGAHPAEHEDDDDGRRRDSRDAQEEAQGQRRTGEGHERREAQGAHQPVGADAHDGVTTSETGLRQPAQPPQVGSDVPRA